jgi:acyl dehydratase
LPLLTSLVGTESAPAPLILDPRWTMNYAAAVGDENPRLFDTRQQQLPVHPMILAHPEWEATKLLMDALALAPEEAERAVEVTHDTRIYRPLFAGVHVETRARVIGVQRRSAGGWLTLQYDTRTLGGELIATTVTGIVYRGVEVEGEDVVPQLAAATDEPWGEGRAAVPLDLGPAACHVYSECSRIWNAIHTDIAVAEKAGLPGLILHGSATLARGVSEVVNRVLDGRPERVTRIYGEFRAMVVVPSRPTLEYGVPSDPTAEVTPFRIVTPSGGLAVANGQIVHQPSA